jgi:hypothetical protein
LLCKHQIQTMLTFANNGSAENRITLSTSPTIKDQTYDMTISMLDVMMASIHRIEPRQHRMTNVRITKWLKQASIIYLSTLLTLDQATYIAMKTKNNLFKPAIHTIIIN